MSGENTQNNNAFVEAIKQQSQYLTEILKRVGSVESRLTEIARLEEKTRVNERVMEKCVDTLEKQGDRLRDAEVHIAELNDLSKINEDLTLLTNRIDSLEYDRNIFRGKKDVIKEILKWTTGVLGAILVYMITKG